MNPHSGQWKPGQSGNPSGRPKTKLFKDALEKALKEASGDRDMLTSVALSLLTKALEGDVPAIKEVADRIDGKVAQAMIGGDDEDPAIRVEQVVRSIVRPDHSDG